MAFTTELSEARAGGANISRDVKGVSVDVRFGQAHREGDGAEIFRASVSYFAQIAASKAFQAQHGESCGDVLRDALIKKISGVIYGEALANLGEAKAALDKAIAASESKEVGKHLAVVEKEIGEVIAAMAIETGEGE